MEIKANLYLMAIEDEVCIDDLDEFDKLQNEYECLFNEFEKLRHRCKDYKKIITTLAFDVENAKHDYDVVIDNKNELEKCFDDLRIENEALRLELKEKNRALENCLNENFAPKISINEKEKCRHYILSESYNLFPSRVQVFFIRFQSISSISTLSSVRVWGINNIIV